jgi:shikimate kinase
VGDPGSVAWQCDPATRPSLNRSANGDDVKRILITGMSGTGKSSVIAELARRGFKAVDTDYGGLSELVSVPDDELTGLDPGQDWVWRADRIQELLSTEDTDLLFLSGTSPNQGRFYPQFDHIILLTAPVDLIVERLATRATNPYGKRPEEVERVRQLIETVEPLLRKRATHVIETSIPLEDVVAEVLRAVECGP